MKLFLTGLIFLQFMIGGICSNVPPVPSAEVPDEDLQRLRAEVRSIIAPDCGSCHTSSLATAKPAAMAVFDLVNDDWPAEMSAKQLESLASRSEKLPDSLRILVRLLVSAEIARNADS